MMTKAFYNCDYGYINHTGKMICFHFRSTKRVKTKVINFLKHEHQEAKILKFLESLQLGVETFDSRHYKRYNIVDL